MEGILGTICAITTCKNTSAISVRGMSLDQLFYYGELARVEIVD